MAIVNTHYGFCAKGGALNFTYTGEYNVRDDGVVELLTSGTLVFLDPAVIDIFCVGGGGSGGSPRTSVTNYTKGLAGGGGGYTATLKRQNVSGSIEVVIGAGGTYSPFADGGTTSFGTLLTANGGASGRENGDPSFVTQGGRNGGSGGGGGRVNNQSLDGIGGSDGSNGLPAEGLSPYIGKGGAGQGTTTREFGEASGKLYAGGGGGGTYFAGNTPIYNIGGTGGGGAGAWVGTRGQFATAGSANTGGGGGGGAAGNMLYAFGGSGGTGICCFRTAK